MFFVRLYPPHSFLFKLRINKIIIFNNNGSIQLVDSALTYNAPGIYAGTTTIIPEPSAFALFGLGALLLGLFKRKKAF